MTRVAEPARGLLELRRAPLGRTPQLARIVALVDAHDAGFVLTGRWGLPESAGPEARVLLVGVDPDAVEASDPFAALDGVDAIRGAPRDGAVGGGLVGWLGFGLSRRVEPTLGPQPPRPQAQPAAALGWYGDVLRRDPAGTWWVEALMAPGAGDDAFTAVVRRWQARIDAAPDVPGRGTLGPMRIRGGAAGHRAAVVETIERIRAGELFQANVCLRLEGEVAGTVAGLVEQVLTATDPWYGGWMKGPGDASMLSASPELFLRRQGTAVRTGPIKGTLPREAGRLDPSADPAAAALLASAKDRAEHVMIVDLMRNDLGRVCDYGSICPDPVPTIEPHAGVWHLVSTVRGTLHEGFRDGRLVKATFPPGSVTGAPKVQALRVIDAVEGTGREAYTGAHGLLSPVSGLELGVTIRTLECRGGAAWLGVGGGIVADSRPQAELDEALGKAAALLAAAGSRVVDEGAPGVAAGADVQAPREPGDGGPRWMPSGARRPDPSLGLLETVAVHDGRPVRLAEHLARLSASVRELGPASGLRVPRDLADRIAAALGGPAPPSGRLRLELVPGGEPRIEVVAFSPVPDGGVPLTPFIVPGGLGAHKWRDRGLVEALAASAGGTPLLMDASGDVLEASWANLWWEAADGVLRTPALDGRLLPGVTRAALLAAAGDRARAVPAPQLAELAGHPLLLTSARGLTPARLPGASPQAVERARVLAAELAPLLD